MNIGVKFHSILKPILIKNKDIPIILEYRNFNILEIEESVLFLKDLEEQLKLSVYKNK